MVFLREMVTNRLQLNGDPKAKRVQGLPIEVYPSTYKNFSDRTKRSGLSVVSLSIVVITTLILLFVYCFFVEYRLSKFITKMNDFEKRQKELEEMVELLMKKNEELKNSKYLGHGQLKQTTEISNMPNGDWEVPASEDDDIKISSNNPHPLSFYERNNTSTISNAQSENVFTKIRVRRSGKKIRNGNSESLRHTTLQPSTKREKYAARLPLIHLENKSPSFREKQLEAGKSFNFWREADWVKKLKKHNFNFNPNTGYVEVQRSGAYLVYVQIVYHDAVGRWSAGIDVNGEIKAKCLESEQLRDVEYYSPENHGVYKQCSISTVVHLGEKEKVSIKCMYGHRTILSQPEFTFWGMVKLA